MRIRAMEVADYEAVIALWQSCEGIGLSAADASGPVARYLARNPGMSFIALAEDGQVVGAALCGHDGRRGYLHHVAVAPDRRGQGLGEELVARCLQALQGEGIDKCHLFVYTDNHSGRAFWKKVGWLERDTLVLMSKDL
jgi:N-acetylglutamate synthase